MEPFNPLSLVTTLKTHAFYIVIGLVCLVGFRSWLQEHDQRLQAEQTIKVSEAAVQSLQAQIKATTANAQAASAQVTQRVREIHTPTQAIAAIPELSTLDLKPRAVPEMPTAVTVEALPLVQELAQCKVDRIQLQACTTNYAAEVEIVGKKDDEIKALKKKPSFWKRVTGSLKNGTVAIVIFEGVKLALTHSL